MVFPGKMSLLLSADVRYLKPSFLDDRLVLRAVVEQKLDTKRVLLLKVEVTNPARGEVCATGRVQVMMKGSA
jgi:acyl-CoA thioesterase FadM